MAAHSISAPIGTSDATQASRPVLVLEDDAAVAATICAALARDGWRTVTAGTLAEGRLCLHRDNPRLVIADLGLPDGNGIAFVREAAAFGGLGVIVVSGQSDEVDRVVGLEVGADDYLTKPFSLREMVARVRALNRRLGAATQEGARPGLQEAQAAPPDPPPAAPVAMPPSWTIAGLSLQPSRFRLLAEDGGETRLTGAEAGLLYLLLMQPEHLADRETISLKVLGRKLLPEQRGVDQLASNLRHKLVAASRGQMTIAAQRGRGYRLVW